MLIYNQNRLDFFIIINGIYTTQLEQKMTYQCLIFGFSLMQDIVLNNLVIMFDKHTNNMALGTFNRVALRILFCWSLEFES